jgi:hypothetical protein
MEAARAKTISAIEERLAAVEPGSPRAHILESARQFKANWIELGQQLSQVFEQKLYEQWGYDSFDRYVTAELHLRRDTAHKLVRSYTFVQHARPEFLAPEKRNEMPPINVVDFISKKREMAEVPPEEIQEFANQAFDNAWSPRTVSAKWRSLVSDDNRVEATQPEDKSDRAVRRAHELAERLQKALMEIPGLDGKALDAVNEVLQVLESASA